MNRRAFSSQLLKTVSSYALLSSVWCNGAFAKSISSNFKHWAIRLNEYCQDLRTNEISVREWQLQVESLFNDIEYAEFMKFIDFEVLVKGFEYPDLGVSTKPVKFPSLNGLPERTAFVKKIFGMKKDRAIIPHGHSNMASAHLILKGEMHVRHYEKIEEQKDALIIKPTIDKIAKTGDASSISDEKDNVHWFVANTDTAFTFDVIMLDLNERSYDIHNLDIYAHQRLENGLLLAPKLDVETALKKYGKLTHH